MNNENIYKLEDWWLDDQKKLVRDNSRNRSPMHRSVFLISLVIMILISCKQGRSSFQIPDISSYFKTQLGKKDSTLIIDSFYLIGIDTMTAKLSLQHSRFPFLHLSSRIQKEIDSLKKASGSDSTTPDYDGLSGIKEREDEKKYVTEEIDSVNKLLLTADSVKAIGYRAIYKVTVSKPNSFTISDTIAYSLSTEMELADWDRNVEKAIDSIAIGRHSVGVNFKINF